MSWSVFFIEGGWGMYPTSVFAMLLLGAAIVYALRPENRFVPLLVSLGVVTLASGFLGFSVGLITTFHAVQRFVPEERPAIALQGIAESGNNLVLALIGFVLAALLTAVGGARIARGPRWA